MSLRPSLLTKATLTFRKFSLPKAPPTGNFFKFVVFKNNLRNKPQLHIEGVNKVKISFSVSLNSTCWVLFVFKLLATFSTIVNIQHESFCENGRQKINSEIS